MHFSHQVNGLPEIRIADGNGMDVIAEALVRGAQPGREADAA